MRLLVLLYCPSFDRLAPCFFAVRYSLGFSSKEIYFEKIADLEATLRVFSCRRQRFKFRPDSEGTGKRNLSVICCHYGRNRFYHDRYCDTMLSLAIDPYPQRDSKELHAGFPIQSYDTIAFPTIQPGRYDNLYETIPTRQFARYNQPLMGCWNGATSAGGVEA